MKKGFKNYLSAGLALGVLASSAPSLNVLAAGPSVSPYTTVQAEKAAVKNGVEIATEGDVSYITSLEKGDSFSSLPLDFTNGAKSITITYRTTAAGWFNINLDKADGDLVGACRLKNTNGQFQTITVNTKDIEGRHTLVFTGNVGNVDIDSYVAEPSTPLADDNTPTPGETDPGMPGVDLTVNPYATNQGEAATELKDAMLTPNKQAVSIRQGGYIAIKDVDFSKGVSAFTLNATSSTNAALEVRLDSATGTSLGNVKLTKDSKVATLTVNQKVEGKHDLYFVSGNGICNLDSWVAVPQAAEEEKPPVDDQPVVTINPYDTIQGEASTELKDAMITPNKQAVSIRQGGYAAVKALDFANGASSLEITAHATHPAVLEVRLDAADGASLGQINVGKANDTQTLALAQTVSGKHDLYFVAVSGSTNLDCWKASEKKVEEEKPPVVDTVNPYETIQGEASTELNNAMITPNKQSVSIRPKGYVVVKNVDFTEGLSAFEINAVSTSHSALEVRLDAADGELLGNVKLNESTATKTLNVTKAVTGKHDVYFVSAAGISNLDSWKAVAKKAEEEKPPVVDTVNPYETIQGEASTELNNAMLTPNKQSVSIRPNGYVVVKNVDFSEGLSAFEINAVSTSQSALEVRLDAADGELLGNVKLNNSTATKTLNVTKAVTGKHDVYFVSAAGISNLDSWKAVAKKTDVDPEPVKPVVDINPYVTVEGEAATELQTSKLSPKKDAMSIGKNGYAGYKNVDFSKGINTINVKAYSQGGGVIEVRLDKADGELLGKVNLTTTNTERTLDVKKNISGKHDLYFVSLNSASTLDSWTATEYKEEHVDPIPDPDPIVTEGKTVKTEINSWGTGYVINFKISNTTDKQIDGWKLKIKKSQVHIESSWCANVTEDGEYYIFTPMSWNNSLYAHGEIQIGLVGSGSIGDSIDVVLE